MAHKSFKRAQNLDPIYFEVPGKDDAEVRFDCVNDLPAGVILVFAEVMGGDEAAESDEPKINVIQAVKDVFDAAIVDGQREQFWTMTKDKDNGIGLGMLMDIATWLAEQYTARPTGPSSDGGQSAKSSGSGSTGGALHAVTTYSKPELAGVTT